MPLPTGSLVLLAEASLASCATQALTAGRSGSAAMALSQRSCQFTLLGALSQQTTTSCQSSSGTLGPLALARGLGTMRCDGSIQGVAAIRPAGTSLVDSLAGPLQSSVTLTVTTNSNTPNISARPAFLRRMSSGCAMARAVTLGPAARTTSLAAPTGASRWALWQHPRSPLAGSLELQLPGQQPPWGAPGVIRFLSGGVTSGSSSTSPGPAAASSACASSNGESPTRDPAAAAAAARPSTDAVYNLPNAVSAARLLSGPVIGYWLMQGHYEAATIALAISGASDWLDGFLARRMGASSVFGSYLDPLADKVLIGCVAAALLANGSMPTWLAVVVVGRDALLVSGAFVFRLRGFGWRWPGREAFFRTVDAARSRTGYPPGGGSGGPGGVGEEGVAFMRPLLVSKANTVLQLVLLGGYLTRGMYAWPDGDVMFGLELATATTTTLSLAAYGTMALQGKLFKER